MSWGFVGSAAIAVGSTLFSNQQSKSAASKMAKLAEYPYWGNAGPVYQESMANVYPAVSRAMRGGGFMPAATQARFIRREETSAKESFQEGRGLLQGYLNRTVRASDVKVRQGIGNLYSAGYYKSRDVARRGREEGLMAERQRGMDMAQTLVAQNKGLGIGWNQTVNAQIAQNANITANMGSFGSNISEGLGRAGGAVYGGSQYNAAERYGQYG